MSEAALELCEVSHVYNEGQGNQLTVLDGAAAKLMPGEIVALVGPSGAGKSTLLHIAGLLEKPTGGDVKIAGKSSMTMNDAQRTALRRDHLGFVYQFHHLLPEFTAQENVAMPLRISGQPRKQAQGRALELLDGMGLADRASHLPSQLSGGEQQRVAIVRALAVKPAVLLADEPTGNLDPQNAAKVFDGFVNFVREQGVAALIATHNMELARAMDRTLLMQDGKLIDHTP